MTSSTNKKNLETLIDIMSDYISDNNHFTYQGNPILNKITLDNPNELSKIYYKSSSLNQFIIEMKEGKHGFRLTQYNESCFQRIYNNISDSKCKKFESYKNENMQINIINKSSSNLNSKIIKFKLNENNTYDIIFDDNDDNDDDNDDDNNDDNDNDNNDLSNLGLIATTLNLSIKSEKIKDKIINKYFESIK